MGSEIISDFLAEDSVDLIVDNSKSTVVPFWVDTSCLQHLQV